LGLDRVNNVFLIHPDFFVPTQKQNVNYTSYHRYYSPTLSGGLREIEEGTYDASESEVVHAQCLAWISALRNAIRWQSTQTGTPSGPC
jgi:hypothetical protein